MTNRERAEELGGGYEIRIVEIEQALNEAEARGRKYAIRDESQAESRGFHRGRKQGLIEAAAIANHVFDPMDPEAWPARKAAETILAQASKKGAVET